MPDWSDLAGQVLRSGSPMSTPMVIGRNGQHSWRLWADYHPVLVHGQNRVLILLQTLHADVSHSKGLLDPLSGLPGRVLLFARLEQALVRSRTNGTLTTVVVLDVAPLAKFNCEYGFDQGDELLTMLSQRLRQGVRDDVTVARYGGDEFAVVTEHSHGTGEAIAERTREVAGWPMRIGQRRHRPGLRVSWVTSDGQASVHSVLERAEQQLQH